VVRASPSEPSHPADTAPVGVLKSQETGGRIESYLRESTFP
jgi:hypothetical protein